MTPPERHGGPITVAAGPHPGRRIALIAGLIVVATVLHYGINLQEGAIHDLLTRSYYIPIVLAGLWFGARGGFAAALAVTVVFFPHALHGWNAPYTLVFRMIEIVMYYAMGILTGVLSSRVTRALAAERAARVARESALAEKEYAYQELRARTGEVFALEEQVRRSERLAALGKLSAGLAHEIRNPLGSIKTAVEVLADRSCAGRAEGDGDSDELFEVIVEETERLNRILTAFLDFARAERGAGDTEPPRAELRRAVEQLADLVRAQLEGREIELLAPADGLEVVTAIPPSALRQVLLNLVLNAAEAIGRSGRIELSVIRRTPAAITLAIADDGPGLPEGLGDEIFDPFVSTKPGGTGLGLSVVARVLDTFGGAIAFDRTVAAGCRAVVTLPLAPE